MRGQQHSTSIIERVRHFTISTAISVLCFVLISSIAFAQSDVVEFEIDAQGTKSALLELAEESGVQIIFTPDLVAELSSDDLHGRMTVDEAIERLLDSSDLSHERVTDRTIVIKRPEAEDADGITGARRNSLDFLRAGVLMAQNQTSAQQTRTDELNEITIEERELDEIIVTGTSIRGVYPESSPLAIFDVEDIKMTGSTSLEEFIQKLPQNLNSLSPGNAGVIGDDSNRQNHNGIDLRGLGVGTTLVLLNGRRMAPSAQARTPDISLIPMSAIQRVEVLTDGASAIYGSDAVGGVVNFVMRNELDGAHTALSIGSVTDGDLNEYRLEQSFGKNWAGGRGLLAYSYFDRTALDARDRPYSAATAPRTLTPDDTRHNILATFEQEGPLQTTLFGNVLVSLRDTESVASTNISISRFIESYTEQEQYFVNFGFSRSISETVMAEFVASYSRNESEGLTRRFDTDLSVAEFLSLNDSDTLELTAKIDGDLLNLPAGPVKFSVGAGYQDEGYSRARLILPADTPDINNRTGRDTNSVFGELLVPFASSEQGIPGIARLELSLAARHTDYSDFGANTNPKVGILWSPIQSLKLRSTYSESFRAPFLSQVNSSSGFTGIISPAALGVPDVWSTDNSTRILFDQGRSNPGLGPEEATSFTAGFDFSPPVLNGLNISGTYFDIEYSDRIAEGDASGGIAALLAPQDFHDLYTVDPSADFIADILARGGQLTRSVTSVVPTGDPAAIADLVNVFLDNRVRNLSLTDISGFDLQIDFTSSADSGSYWHRGVSAPRILSFLERSSVDSPATTRVGTLFNPPGLRIKGYIGLVRENWSSQLNANFVDDYKNPFSAGGPQKIDSWTTVDLSTSYQFQQKKNGFFGELVFRLSIQNLFDEDPPFVAVGGTRNTGLITPVGFDPANASPKGRFISLEVSKQW